MKHWYNIALFNFLLAALLGALLRLAFVVELSWMNYRFFLHAHSHVAMLGWVYLACYAFSIQAFLGEGPGRAPFYRRLFWLTQASVAGMLFSFPFQGYGPASIAFSTAHILFSYTFAYRFLKDLKAEKGHREAAAPGSADKRNGASREPWGSEALIRAAVGFLVFSTLGLWAMGPVIALRLQGSLWYFLSVQFYLHFQFYGWFTFAIFGLFFHFLETRGIAFPRLQRKVFFLLLLISVPLTFALPVTWSTPRQGFFITNSAGVLLQLGALGVFIRMLWPQRQRLAALLPFWPRLLTGFALSAWALKVSVQALTVIPVMATIGYTIRNFTIGFIHLLLLGVVSTFLTGYAMYRPGLRSGGRIAQTGAGFMLAGIVLSELLLFLQGFLLWGGIGFLPEYYEWLFGVSLLIPAGIALMLFPAGKKRFSQG